MKSFTVSYMYFIFDKVILYSFKKINKRRTSNRQTDQLLTSKTKLDKLKPSMSLLAQNPRRVVSCKIVRVKLYSTLFFFFF